VDAFRIKPKFSSRLSRSVSSRLFNFSVILFDLIFFLFCTSDSCPNKIGFINPITDQPCIVKSSMVATREHCAFCFSTLSSTLDPSQHHPVPIPSFSNDSFPLFVTWTKRNDLRGCVGTFSASPLHTALPEYTLISALRDKRFPPITHDELSTLSVCVSLLLDFESVDTWNDWDIGRHGIRIKFNQHGRENHATFLPEVAADQVAWGF
jgi:uncharacterized protein (TIGR00296 family)